MNEISLINKITDILSSKYIGDDCAYLSDLGVTVTQDSLVEDVHFRRDFITPYQLGYKSIMVNISDVASSGAEPKYVTVALSLPKDVTEEYVEEFYKGAKSACDKFGVEIVGGDITSSDKIYISVSALGDAKGRRISSRKNAKVGQKIITTSYHGSSAAGLKILLEGIKGDDVFVEAHLTPEAKVEFAKNIAQNIQEDYSMMDTSDGFMDAIFKIGQASSCTMKVDFAQIPFDKKIKVFENYQDLVLFGGEDYQIVATVPEELLPLLSDYVVVGEVIPMSDSIVELIDGDKIVHFVKYDDVAYKCFRHFE